MPLVRNTMKPVGIEPHDVQLFGEALWEFVPAAFTSGQGVLTPGSIVYIGQPAEFGSLLTVDSFIEIEAYHYDDRAANIDERCEQIRRAMEEFFPDYTFAVWGKLVRAGWSRDASDPAFTGDMSIDAAKSRFRDRLSA